MIESAPTRHRRLLQLCRGAAHPLQPGASLHRPDRHVDERRRDPVAHLPLLRLRAHRHRHHHPQGAALRRLTPVFQQVVQPAGDGGEHDVVHGAAEGSLDLPDARERRLGHGEPPGRADDGVERAGRAAPPCRPRRAPRDRVSASTPRVRAGALTARPIASRGAARGPAPRRAAGRHASVAARVSTASPAAHRSRRRARDRTAPKRSSCPEMPSASAWCIFSSTAVRRSASPSNT